MKKLQEFYTMSKRALAGVSEYETLAQQRCCQRCCAVAFPVSKTQLKPFRILTIMDGVGIVNWGNPSTRSRGKSRGDRSTGGKFMILKLQWMLEMLLALFTLNGMSSSSVIFMRL